MRSLFSVSLWLTLPGWSVSNYEIFKPFEGNGFPLSVLGEFPQTVSGSARQRYLALVDGASCSASSILARFGLQLASVPYGLAVRLRNGLYTLGCLTTKRAAVPVVCVGNLTVGGTGKTPCVEYVAGFYRRHDRRVAVLSRGYGSAGGRNDEALVLEENLPDVPHLQGADRVALARTAVEELESEILVLDDGFQHRRLARDLDLVLIDATQPQGHEVLLPRGLLREPYSGLRRAHLVILTRCDQADRQKVDALREKINYYAPKVPVIETRHRPVELVNSSGVVAPLDELQDRSVVAFCGIGNPAAFRRTLIDLGANVRAFYTYADHHAYDRSDVENLRAQVALQLTDGIVVTTQKDLVKLRIDRIGDRPLWSLRIRLQVLSGLEELEERLQGVLT